MGIKPDDCSLVSRPGYRPGTGCKRYGAVIVTYGNKVIWLTAFKSVGVLVDNIHFRVFTIVAVVIKRLEDAVTGSNSLCGCRFLSIGRGKTLCKKIQRKNKKQGQKPGREL